MFVTELPPQDHRSSPGDAPQTMSDCSFIITPNDRILVTGATGFIGSRVVTSLLNHGFRNLLCFARPSSEMARLETIGRRGFPEAQIDVLTGNLLSRKDCEAASKDVTVIFHLAAGTREKSFPDAFMNSVITTRNLLDASLQYARLQRFVLVSSFSVYTNCQKPSGRLLDESCPIEVHPELCGEAYSFAKVKQEQLVVEYGKKVRLPYVVVRPGSVYGEGRNEIVGRVGISAFGLFLHLGGSNTIPFTYVENCADAIVRAGLVQGVDGEFFNIVDDDLPSSRRFLRQYKKSVKSFKSVYVPHAASLTMCFLWEKYSRWSNGQLPPALNLRRWHADWKKTHYSNEKVKLRLGWAQRIPTAEGLARYFQGCVNGEGRA